MLLVLQYRRLKKQYGHGTNFWIQRYLHRTPAKDGDEVFPVNLTKREDFQLALPRYMEATAQPNHMIAAIQNALAKPREQREHDDLLVLLNWVGSLPFFRGIGTRKLWDLCQRLMLVYHPPGTILIKCVCRHSQQPVYYF